MSRFFAFLLFAAAIASGQIVPGQYIVELSTPPLLAGSAGPAKGAAAAGIDRQARIQAEQESVRFEVERLRGRVTGAVDTVANALIAVLPDSEAAALAASPGVARVYPVREYRLHLDRALILHSVPQAWERIGGRERAGLGMKIAILDSGIDIRHPAFQDPSLRPPEGFPRFTLAADERFTNEKVIVARSYGTDLDPSDRLGHGTEVAAIAAAAPHFLAGATISGIAPKAFLGNYKVILGSGITTTNAILLRAMDDAVKDGMDVINLSLGESTAVRPNEDPIARAIETASAAGVIVVVSAGNEGSDPNTIDSPATAGSAIAVGALRTAVGYAVVEGLPPFATVLSAETGSRPPISAPLFDVARIDPSGLACSPLPPDSLAGRAAFILRGECTFETKVLNAAAAGAVAALLYTAAASPSRPRVWIAGAGRLPAMMLSNGDGLRVKERLAGGEVPVRLEFPFIELASFSSRGPSADLAVKPDLVALGAQVLTAAPVQANGEPGAASVSGTSFSAPMVSGAAAVVKAGRPGLTAQQYRSLIINSARPLYTTTSRVPVQQAGTGVLDVAAAMTSTATAFPSALGLGTGGGTANLTRDLQITNVGAASEGFSVNVDALQGPIPTASTTSFVLGPGQRQSLTFSFSGADLAAGEYQGFVEIRGDTSGTVARVPYWYAVPSNRPAFITVLFVPDSGRVGSTQDFYFRVTDPVGLAVMSPIPQVSPASGGGEVTEVREVDAEIPGAWRARVRLGPEPGTNVFEIRAGDLPVRGVQIRGTAAGPQPTP